MELQKNYNPAEIEEKWYSYWIEKKYFHSEPDSREPFTIVIPPPNVTGVLHMGHIMNNTIQDVLTRRARMQGKNACWVPGTDHASIATEAKVVNFLKQKGINKFDLSREKFMEYAWEWTHKHGGIILQQLRKIGASCDWDRTKFTLDDNMHKSVIKVFVDMYNKGLIYRGIRMVNWDPAAKTSISDEEVEYKETQGHLYYIRYKIVDSDEYLIVATTRPETILADTAVCVNPNDTRYSHLHDKKVIVPVINREVPIITDEYVDIEFGTGALKITPAHDPNDYQIGLKFGLEVIDIFNEDATLNAKAKFYIGKNREDARKLIMEDMQKLDLIEKVENYNHNVGYSQRTHVQIEPRISIQWFMKMKDISADALNKVMDDTIGFYPSMYKNTYRHWMDNIRDWNISRQLWWGQRIPAYYINGSDEFVVAETDEQALEIARKKSNNPNLKMENLVQDPDVLDTWFSSWLWPISVFNGILEPDNKEIDYYYPTNVLVTAPDIIFFWVARMVMSGYHYRRNYPFKDVYFTGLVRDDKGRKMSKQLGNSPEPLELVEKYGADGVRVGMLLCASAGSDLLYKEELIEQGRNFSNKIWNAARLINSWNVDENVQQPSSSTKAIEWFETKLNQSIEITESLYNSYRISEVLMTLYRLFWDDFASWFLEIIKPAYGQAMDKKTYDQTRNIFDKILRLMHPFIPFVTEEIWQTLELSKETSSLTIAKMPIAEKFDVAFIERFDNVKTIISTIRKIRLGKQMKYAETIDLFYKTIDGQYDGYFDEIIKKSCNLNKIEQINEKLEGASSFIVKNAEYYIPAGKNENIEEVIQKLTQELEYTQGFLQSVRKKLENEKFVQNAPAAVLERENQKLTDAQNKIKALKEQINFLKK